MENKKLSREELEHIAKEAMIACDMGTMGLILHIRAQEEEIGALQEQSGKLLTRAICAEKGLARAESENARLRELEIKIREAVVKDRTMFISKKSIEDGCFHPDKSKDCACRIRAQLRNEICADIDAIEKIAEPK